ncbi:MAG: hypothetical protein PVG22_17020 [Chromatiales bacterium]|jgi:hypothetical protein
MTKRRDLILGLTLAPLAPLAFNTKASEATKQPQEKPQFLFVQTSAGMRYNEGELILKDVSPITVLFSDRPERLAGHMATDDFVPFWSEGQDSFKSNPPNADLALLDENQVDNVVVTLHDPRLEGSDLIYRVDILEGKLPPSGAAASLFIDIIGRPLTPVSFAGARRRMWRRAVIY